MKKILSLALLIPVLLITVSCTTGAKNTQKPGPITPETALQRYLDNNDDSFSWEIKDKYPIEGLTAYEILLTSQNWREHIWRHQLTVFVPDDIMYDGALLYITGGSNNTGLPNWTPRGEDRAENFADVAQKNKSVVAMLRQTPNQPLYDGLVEDQLISFTLHNFKQDKDYSWPLLFPMVKSAIRAMDAVQVFAKDNLEKEISRFTVSGGSKRGWTTWLTAASDSRVEAICPMVMDVLNMPVSLDYHLEAWNEYSIQIEDYTKLEIPQSVRTEEGDAITKMVDPYSYRKKLTMPKMIFIGTNDEYWPVDAIKHYIDDIPGENYIHYVPNAGHDLGGGEQALRALSAFWGRTLDKKQYPECSYDVGANKTSVSVWVKSSPDELLNAYIWSAESKDRDFRDEKWKSEELKTHKNEMVIYNMKFPKNGFKAFYIDLEYSDPKGGKYTKSTRMYVVDNEKVL
jgi:PhoPQ-activated pathogenicity-related protein